jgi:hypothetical protein
MRSTSAKKGVRFNNLLDYGTNQEHVKAAGRDFSVSPPIGPKPPG